MRPRVLTTVFVALTTAAPAAPHDLFLELSRHRVPPSVTTSIALVNGTFGHSENVITRDRMLDVSVVGPGDAVAHPPETRWRDEGTTSWIDLELDPPGTYVIGVSTAPRVIELSAEAFHRYLRHDGVLDVLEQRTRDGRLGEAARERYSKHVKAVAQVGAPRTGAHDAVLGYPIEIVPLRNPDHLRPGQSLPVRVLFNGAPLESQLVYASFAGHHAHDESGGHVEAFSGRTDDDGVVEVPVDTPGRWYVRLIHMIDAADADVDHESFWATLTFEVPEARPAGALAIAGTVGGAALLALLVALVGGHRPGRRAAASR